MVSELTPSTQDYLKVIWNLSEWSDEPITTSVISERIGLRPSTVSDALRKLAERELIDHQPYGAVSLTDAGRRHALAMVRRHRLIETFLVETLGYGWDEVHDEAETLEHAVSDLMIDRIADLLGHPTRDPHGDPIPSADGTIVLPDAVRLSTVEHGRVTVERISDADPALLQFFAAEGIGIGATLDVAPGEPFTETLSVGVTGREVPIRLGMAAAAAVWVSGR